MKKIFYIANVRLPTEKAHGIQIMKTCEALAENGADLTLIVPRRFNNIKTSPFDYYQVKENFKIARVATIDLIRLGKIGFLIETLVFSEFATWYIRLNSLKKTIRVNRAVYSRDAWPLLNVSLLGWKLFWEAHMGSKSFLTRKLLKRLNGIVAITDGLKKLYTSLGMPEERIVVVPDAVDLKKFDVAISKAESRKKLGLPINKKVVMYIGLFDEWKGYKTLLEASKILNNSEILVTMIGGTEKQIAELKNQYPNVFFLGYKEYSDLPENQKAADLLVLPNSGKYPISKLFTSPLKLFAYMASGVPIVAADLPSIREIVDDRDVAFFKADDSADLAKIIKTTLQDDFAQDRAMRVKNKVSEYTWDNRSSAILNFINKNV